MKLAHYDDYGPKDTLHAESALLTIWAALGDLTDDLVLVGGLVPRYLCKAITGDITAVTMDVDLGISLELSTGQYETVTRRLSDHGFDWKDKRFVKTMAGVDVFLDFLTDKPGAMAADSVVVDDIAGVSAVFGVNRALEFFRTVQVRGIDLQGAEVSEQIKVCEVGPYLCLKLQAYAGRGQAKDVFDVVRVVRDYDQGRESAVHAFHAEKGRNLAYDVALRMLNERFVNERSKGPIQYADFCLPTGRPDSEERDYRWRQRVNEALDVATLLRC